MLEAASRVAVVVGRDGDGLVINGELLNEEIQKNEKRQSKLRWGLGRDYTLYLFPFSINKNPLKHGIAGITEFLHTCHTIGSGSGISMDTQLYPCPIHE